MTDQKQYKFLVEPGHLSEDDFRNVQTKAEATNRPFETTLIESGLLTQHDVGRAYAFGYDLPYVDITQVSIPDEILNLLPESVAKVQQTIFFGEENGTLNLATAHPENYEFLHMAERKVGRTVQVYYALPSDIDIALRNYEGNFSEQIADLVRASEHEEGSEEEYSEVVVRMVNLFLEHARNANASDIHLQPLEHEAHARFRIDGVLKTMASYPVDLHQKIVFRIKILAELHTDETAAPQDGRFEHTNAGTTFDVRVSIVPTTVGENVVIRILKRESKAHSLEEIGLSGKDLERVQIAAGKPHGMIVTVGPTGSGKTTTLYTILQTLNTDDKNIMTIEDPVEYNIEYVAQIQVNPAKDLRFATGLRTIVRQDPDVIMVGEIRDAEAAAIAVNAAMTGHLLLSTLHTNDAATTFPRLIEMGIEPFLIASSLQVVIAQRLARRICEGCRKSVTLSVEEQTTLSVYPELLQEVLQQTGKAHLHEVMLYQGAGCTACSGLGYRGRIGLFEVLTVSSEVRELITKQGTAAEIEAVAKEEGMTTMMQAGVAKALSGVTTLEEVVRVTRSS